MANPYSGLFNPGPVVPSPDHYKSIVDYADQVNRYAANTSMKSMQPISERMIKMIAMRLHIDEGAELPFDFITAHQIDKERAVVFLVHGGQAQMIEDDGNLFPSDALITKLRLLME